MPIPLKPFYMIRHGESIANKDGYMSGSINTPLTERGRQQAKEAQSAFKKLPLKPKIIVHSHLSRAIDTAKIINEVANLPMHESPLLAEIEFGDWGGQAVKDIRPKFYAGENPPNGESHVDFETRIKKGLTYALNLAEQPVMIVCHGGVFRAFYGLYNKTITPTENAKLYHFEPNNGETDFPWCINLIE